MKNTTFLTVSAAFSFMLLTLVGCASFEDIKKQADAGDREKQYEIALMFRDGDGIPADSKKSAEYMMMAVKNNYMPAAWETIQDIYNKKDISRASDFISAYQFLLTVNPRGFGEVKTVIRAYRSLESTGIGYLKLLAKNNNGNTKILRELFQKNLSREYLTSHRINRIQKQLQETLLPAEIAEAKRIAKAKRIAEAKRQAKLKYPCQTEKMSGIKLYKDIDSGISRKWMKNYAKQMGSEAVYEKYTKNCRFNYGEYSNDDAIIYGAEISVGNVIVEDLVEKYKQQFPGIKVKVNSYALDIDSLVASAMERSGAEILKKSERLALEKRLRKKFEDEQKNNPPPKEYELENENVFIRIKYSYGWHVDITDRKYKTFCEEQKVRLEKEENARREIEYKKESQKALDF